MEALACVVFRFVKRSKPYAAFYHFFFGIWMIFALSFDPHRVVVLWFECALDDRFSQFGCAALGSLFDSRLFVVLVRTINVQLIIDLV